MKTVVLAVVLLSIVAPLLAPTSQSASKTVILVRHAEKAAPGDPEFDPSTPADPPLNTAGRERAAALAHSLGEADVTSVFATEYARTRETVEPLARATGVTVTIHPARDSEGLASLLLGAPPASTSVVAGHSDTVPVIIEALGAGAVDPIEESWEYDNLYVVVIDGDGRARVTTFKYGSPSSR